MNHHELINIVGHPATAEFDVVWRDWIKECEQENDGDIDPQDTAYLMFAAGYLARRNDELLKDYQQQEGERS